MSQNVSNTDNTVTDEKSIDWFSTQVDRCFESGLYGGDIRIYITKDYYFEVKGIKFEDNVLTLQETKIGQIFKLSNEPNIDMFKEDLLKRWNLWDKNTGKMMGDDRCDYKPWAHTSLKALATELGLYTRKPDDDFEMYVK